MATKKKKGTVKSMFICTDDLYTSNTAQAAMKEADDNGFFDYNDELPVYEFKQVGVAKKTGVTFIPNSN